MPPNTEIQSIKEVVFCTACSWGSEKGEFKRAWSATGLNCWKFLATCTICKHCCQQCSLLLCCPSSFTHLQMWSAQGHYLVLPTRAVPSPPESRDHISLFFSVHARAVMLTRKVLLSGQLWNIFTLMYSSGALLASLIIDLHGSSLVKVQGRSHRPDSDSTWHAERGETDYCSKETVNPRNQLHASHRSFILMSPHQGTAALRTLSPFSTSQERTAKRFQLKQKKLLNR